MSFPHPFPYDPTYGYDLDQLCAIPSPETFPEFEAFWRGRYEQAVKAPLDICLAPSPFQVKGHRVQEITFLAADGFRIGGWLVVPEEGEPVCAMVHGHGYGGRDRPDEEPGKYLAIRLYVCARGFHQSASPELPNASSGHVIHGIESIESYLVGQCAYDLWAGVGVMEALFPEFIGRIGYSGASFGGGMGALAVPWDRRIWRCYLGVPTFGNHPFRVSVPCGGSGESVRQYVLQHPEAMEVLRYFDAARSALYMEIPTLVSCALFDPAVPPPGQFSVYNAIPSLKALVIEPASHFEYPGQQVCAGIVARACQDWFSGL